MKQLSTWEQALVITGQWTPEHCDGFQRPSDNHEKVCVRCGAVTNSYGSHDIPPAPEGDPAACLVMVKYILADVRRDHIGHFLAWKAWRDIFSEVRGEHLSFHDALAAAVVALGEKK